MNGPEPITSSALICVLGSVAATRSGIMNGTFDEGLPSDCSTRPYGSFSVSVKVLSFTAFMSPTRAISDWPIESLGAPALDRGDAVGRRDRLAVMPFEAVAQGEGVGELVGRDVVLVDHLRLDLELLVHREQRVPDEVAVISLTM